MADSPQEIADRLRKTERTRRAPIYQKLTKAFWEAMVEEHKSVLGIAQYLGASEHTIANHLNRLGVYYDRSACSVNTRAVRQYRKVVAELRERYSPKIPDVLHLHGIDAIVTSDWQCPATSLKWWERARKVAQKTGIRTLVGNGDLMNYDLYSPWKMKFIGQAATAEEEMCTFEALLEYLYPAIDTLYYVAGNHDDRLMYALNTGIEVKRIKRMFQTNVQVIMTWHSHMRLDNWHITHPPKGARTTRLNFCRQLAHQHKGFNIMLGHGHKFSLGYDDDGVTQIAENGGMFAPQAYAEKHDSPHPKMQRGFFAYKDGVMMPFADGWVDWSKWGCKA